jgi:nucleoside-diphosphate-sugar epimerase
VRRSEGAYARVDNGIERQIGDLALRLQESGHSVFGVDIRPNTWTDQVETLLQDLSSTYTDFRHGIGYARYPENLDAVVHLAAHARYTNWSSSPTAP